MGPRLKRAALAFVTAVSAAMTVLVLARRSPVGDAPPLTALPSEPGATSAPAPAVIGPEPEPAIAPAEASQSWRAREIKIGEIHPLDLAWNPNGASIYVSGDDATLREYKLKTGEIIHQASVPAQGDHIRLVFDRFIAVLRHEDASRVPVLDTTAWDRDPILLHVGPSPGDLIELPDGKSVIASTHDGKRVSRFELPGGMRVGDIALPHATGQLFVVRAEGRSYVAAMGGLTYGGRAAGAWIDLFDPSEAPFGATRRSISIGREPRYGAVARHGGAILFPDRASNTVTLLSIAGATDMMVSGVGQQPEAAFLLQEDRYGITINSGNRTATVVELGAMKVARTLMLDGEPRCGATSRDGRTLFVALGGTEWPPKGSGAMVIAGDPPRIVASLPTGKGASAVAVSKDGKRAAIANYYDRSITIIEP